MSGANAATVLGNASASCRACVLDKCSTEMTACDSDCECRRTQGSAIACLGVLPPASTSEMLLTCVMGLGSSSNPPLMDVSTCLTACVGACNGSSSTGGGGSGGGGSGGGGGGGGGSGSTPDAGQPMDAPPGKPDAAMESKPDAAPKPDAAAEAKPDAGMEAAPESKPGTAPDAPPEAKPEAPMDAGPDLDDEDASPATPDGGDPD